MAGSVRTSRQEVEQGDRFAFGDNWARFLRVLDEQRIEAAAESLRAMLERRDLVGGSFLDVGCGSGLFSLAARRLGARVCSFDFDTMSVGCAQELRHRYGTADGSWEIRVGSVLDAAFLATLGQFDVVYSWGVLHHTGDMWAAMANVDRCVARDGQLFIALYNHQPYASRYWTAVKRAYNRHPLARPLLLALHALYPTLPSVVLRAIERRSQPRGMSPWYDLRDWVGGYPFEVARPEDVVQFYRQRGYQLTKLRTVGGRHGCNEFVFRREGDRVYASAISSSS